MLVTGKDNRLISIDIDPTMPEKRLTVICGDMCKAPFDIDIAICSAFIGSYRPVPNTLVGALFWERGIVVGNLARHPAIDLKSQGCWLSQEISGNIHRIGCLELFNLDDQVWDLPILTLKGLLAALVNLLKQASVSGIPVKRVAMPLLGTGKQKVELNYLVPPLLGYCRQALHDIEGLDEIIFYERKPDKAKALSDIILDSVSDQSEGKTVFLSYSSKDYELAKSVYDSLGDHSVSCWMAPQSIPLGRSYLEEIPTALEKIKVLLLLLSEDSVQSTWVIKEASTAISLGKDILPVDIGSVILPKTFRFMLADTQIKAVKPDQEQISDVVLKELEKTIR